MAHIPRTGYLESKLVRIGLGGIVLGSGPLLLIILLAKIGVLSDPNPNPVGPGILAFLTFWPSVICLVTGLARVFRSNRSIARSSDRRP